MGEKRAMDIRYIAFGMIAILALLFIGAKLYIPREKNKTKWEADYALAAQTFFKEPNQQNYEACREALKVGYSTDPEVINLKLNKDRIQIPS